MVEINCVREIVVDGKKLSIERKAVFEHGHPRSMRQSCERCNLLDRQITKDKRAIDVAMFGSGYDILRVNSECRERRAKAASVRGGIKMTAIKLDNEICGCDQSHTSLSEGIVVDDCPIARQTFLGRYMEQLVEAVELGGKVKVESIGVRNNGGDSGVLYRMTITELESGRQEEYRGGDMVNGKWLRWE